VEQSASSSETNWH